MNELKETYGDDLATTELAYQRVLDQFLDLKNCLPEQESPFALSSAQPSALPIVFK